MMILNAFSINMLDSSARHHTVRFTKITQHYAASFAKRSPMTSAVGHADTAAVFSTELGVDVPANRVSVTLEPGQPYLVGQYRGPRLAEGATELPEGATIEWWLLIVEKEI